MAYADYEYYTNTFGGSLVSADDFARLSIRATAYIRYITQGKSDAHDDLDAVKAACCAVTEQYLSFDMAQKLASESLIAAASSASGVGGELQSESVGGYSRSVRSGGESAKSAIEAAERIKSQLLSTAQCYLAATGLLYRGRHCHSMNCSMLVEGISSDDEKTLLREE